MICPQCSIKIADGSKFCNECGANISTVSKQSGMERDVSLGDLKTRAGPSGLKGQDADRSLGALSTTVAPGVGETAGTGQLVGGRYEVS